MTVMTEKGKEHEAAQQLAGLSIDKSPTSPREAPPPPPPPRPVVQQPDEDEDDIEEEDDDNPFADRNAVSTTPAFEKREPVW